MWNGKIYLFNAKNRKILNGLITKLVEYCEWKGYQFDLTNYPIPDEISEQELNDFIENIPLKEKFVLRDYQINILKQCIKNEKLVVLSPTSSGKSLDLYSLYCYGREYGKTLIIVPSLSLIKQMSSDFQDYCPHDISAEIHEIYSGQEKQTDRPLTISTYQSLAAITDKSYFEQFSTVMLDEAHQGDAKTVRDIIQKCVNARFKFGFTGTLDNGQSKIPRLVLEGLFGPVYTAKTTQELVEEQVLSNVEIHALILEHKNPKKFESYRIEKGYICSSVKRNEFIVKLAISRSGPVLILFEYIQHGAALKRFIEDISKRPVYLINGSVDIDIREEIRNIINKEPNAILLGSYQTCQQGMNIVSLKHLILASPTKSQIRLLQSIGRVLRRNEKLGKTSAIVYDIADDIRVKGIKNTTLTHFEERYKIYLREKFPVKFFRVPL